MLAIAGSMEIDSLITELESTSQAIANAEAQGDSDAAFYYRTQFADADAQLAPWLKDDALNETQQRKYLSSPHVFEALQTFGNG